MIHPKQMSKAIIAGPKSEMKKAIDTLHALGELHIQEYQKTQDGFSLGSPLEKSDKVAEVLLKIRSMRAQLPKTKSLKTTRSISLQKLESDVLSAIEKTKELESELAGLQQELKELEPFAALDIGKEAAENYRTIATFVGFAKNVEQMRREIAAITSAFDMKTAAYQKKDLIALFIKKEYKEKALEVLANAGFSDLSLEPLKKHTGDIHSIIAQLKKDISAVSAQKEENAAALETISASWSATLEATEKALQEESERLQAPLAFAASNNAFIAEGYVPTDDVIAMRTRLEKATGNKIHFQATAVDQDENVPTALENPKPARGFEMLLDMFSLPKYHEFDPTLLMFLVFPLFYGFMLGDIGYGLVTLTLFSLLKISFGKNKQARGLFNIMILSSLSTIVFGFLFAEFFGAEEIFGYRLTPVLHRLHEVQELFHISVLIGIVHLNLGFGIGFFNELKRHGFVKASLEKLSWIVLQVGAFGLLTNIGMLQIFVGDIFSVPLPMTVSGTLAAVGAIGILAGEGVRGAVELPAIFSNILSYGRLMAVGLASAALAVVVNEMAFGLFRSGIIGIVGGILILVLGHGINIALGILSPFLHSLRLHYVEFFGKFYHGGGKKYKPFGRNVYEA